MHAGRATRRAGPSGRGRRAAAAAAPWVRGGLAAIGLLLACRGPASPPRSAAAPAQEGETPAAAHEGEEAAALGGEAAARGEHGTPPGAMAEPAGAAAGPCAEVGYETPPAAPSADARAANEAALRAHGAGRYEESARGFREAVGLAPGYAMARFNLACALARLGRLDEARAELEPLLCEDLPTIAPRLTSDPDLAPLAADEALRARLEAIAAQYREAARGGAALVASGETAGGGWSQAVAYVAATRRAVPMGPRVAEEGDFALAATMYVPEEGRVVVVTAVGNDAEDAVPLDRLRVRILRAPLGEVEIDRADLPAICWLQVGLTPTGARLAAVDDLGRDLSWDLTAAGLARTTEPVPRPALNVGVHSWAPNGADPRYAVSRGRLAIPGGREVVLGSPHPSYGRTLVTVDGARGLAFAVSERSGDCGSPDRHVVDRVDLASGRVDRLLLGEGQIIVAIGADGALYVQITALGRTATRRYPDLRGTAFEVLPSGFVLSSSPYDGNPYC